MNPLISEHTPSSKKRLNTPGPVCASEILSVRLYVCMSSETEPFRCVKPKRRSRITHVDARDDLINRSCPSEPDSKPETASEREAKVTSGRHRVPSGKIRFDKLHFTSYINVNTHPLPVPLQPTFCMTPYTPPPSRITCAWLAVMLVYIASIPFFQPALAQSDDVPSATQTVAITNTRVVQAPGQILESATVVIRDGLIEAVGTVEPPFDARIIAGDSLTVYAGFIDGLSHTAVDTPDDDPEKGSFAEQGIRPQRAVRPLLKPGDASKLREAGFGLAHVAPEGQMLPGEGALILLAGDSPDEMILTDRASLFAQMEGAEGSWPNVIKPSTPMAVISQMRDLVREARRRMMLAEAYEDDPSGRSRPPSDAVHSAFFPVLDGDIPIMFYAEDVLDTHRILSMADELDLSIMLSGIPDAFEALDALEASDAPLFLTLDLPKPADGIEADTTDADSTQPAITPQDPGSFFESDLRVRSEKDTEAEATQLKARQRAILDQYAARPLRFTTRESCSVSPA